MGVRVERRTYAWLVVFLLAYLSYALPLIPQGSDDIRMAAVFSIDEADILWQIDHLYKNGVGNLPSFTYGGGLYYSVTLLLKVWSVLGAVTGNTVILALRGFCMIAGIGCLWLTFKLGCLVFDRTTGLYGTFLLLSFPEFLRWAVDGHPDLPQLFWMLAVLVCCVRLIQGFSWKWITLAAVFAGIAFGTKYGGIFLLPVIGMSVLLPRGGVELSLSGGLKKLRERRYLKAVVLIPIVFLGVFVLINPFSIIRFDVFMKTMVDYKEVMGFGHMYEADPSGLIWLQILRSGLGPIHAVAFLAYLLGCGLYVYRKRQIPAAKGILLFWCLLFIAYLMLEVNLRRVRHLLPILPCVLLCVAEAYRVLFQRIQIPRFGWVRLAIPFVLISVSWFQLAAASHQFKGRMEKVEAHKDDLSLGRWLLTEFDDDTSIIYDAYAYIPSQFQRVYRTFGQTYFMTNHFEPDLLVVRNAISSRYTDLSNAERVRIGQEAFLDHHYFYRYLRESRIPGYKLKREFGSSAVYERVLSGPKKGRDVSWLKRILLYQQGRLYGVREAGETLGEIHRSLGIEDESERMFRQASQSGTQAVKLYDRAIDQLKRRNIDLAIQAWEAVLTVIATRPAEDRAAIRQDMSMRLFEAGFYQEAIRETREICKLKPGHQSPLYQLGLFYLANGDLQLAQVTYSEAVEKYGVDQRAVAGLQYLIRVGIQADFARNILNTYFVDG